ncbi:MAG: DNA internalization-related competence protein ComEC/Rec2 [Solimonas sp.]
MDDRQRAPRHDIRVLTLCFTAGVLLVHALPDLLSLFFLCLIAAAALLPWRGRAASLAFAFGVVLTTAHAMRERERQWPDARHHEEHWVEGVVATVPERSAERSGDGPATTWRFGFEPRSETGLPARIRVSWYRAETAVAGAQCWRLQLRLRAPHGSLNPYGFDYEAWLFRQHLGATATVLAAEPCGVASGRPILKLRQAWSDEVDRVAGLRPGGALLKALTIGVTSDLRDADWNAFRLSGTTHLIAISGFNLALVAGFAFFVLRWSWASVPRLALRMPAQRFALYGSALFACVYAALAGFEPPVARALFMLLVLLLAALLHRPPQPSRALALAWCAIVVADPCAVMAPGLWLSFVAVASIFYLVSARWRPEPSWRVAIRVQLFLSLALAPLGLYYFHGMAWAAPFINLLAVPLFALLTPLLLLVTVAAALSSAAATALLPLSARLLEAVLAALYAIAAHAPFAWWPLSAPLAALLLALIGSVLLFAPAGLPLRATGVLCLLPLLWPPSAPVRGGLEVTVLDVGQGLSVLVRTARHQLLFDAGPAFDEGFDAGASVVAPYVLGRGSPRIDLLLLSHGDNDHAGGVPAVRRLLDVRDELGTRPDNPCRDGQRWEWDGVRFSVLAPPDAAGGEDPQRRRGLDSDNNRSCVLKIDGPFSVLLPGDIEKAMEARLLSAHPQALRADVLVAPHHGSASSSTAAFIAAVQPRQLIFASGWHNRFRHPRPAVVRRYLDCGAQAAMTGESGAIRIDRESADAPLRIERWRDVAGHFWNARPATPAYWRRAADVLAPAPCAAPQSWVGFGASP